MWWSHISSEIFYCMFFFLTDPDATKSCQEMEVASPRGARGQEIQRVVTPKAEHTKSAVSTQSDQRPSSLSTKSIRRMLMATLLSQRQLVFFPLRRTPHLVPACVVPVSQ